MAEVEAGEPQAADLILLELEQLIRKEKPAEVDTSDYEASIQRSREWMFNKRGLKYTIEHRDKEGSFWWNQGPIHRIWAIWEGCSEKPDKDKLLRYQRLYPRVEFRVVNLKEMVHGK